MKNSVFSNNVSAVINNSKNILRNYNGEPLKPGEVLFPIIQSDLFIEENVTNPDSITRVGFGGKIYKAVLTAIPESYVLEAKAQNNYTINDMQGNYWDKGSISIDEVEDEYGFALGSSPSAEEDCLEPDALSLIKELIVPLIDKSPKHAFAYLLNATGINGKEFEHAMKLGHDAANTVRKEAEHIVKEGLANYDIDSLKANKSKNQEYYLDAAYDILDRLMNLI